TGEVLVASGGSAELYDPLEGAFAMTAAPGGAHTTPTLSLLPDGRALLFGPPTLAGELYDPASATWSFTAAAARTRYDHRAASLPDGRVLVTGGHISGIDVGSANDAELFDPAANGGAGAFTTVGPMGTGRSKGLTLLLQTGDVLVAGGRGCYGNCFGAPVSEADLFGETAALPRPAVTSAPASVVPGQAVAIAGLGFLGFEASGGRGNASNADVPIAIWTPLDGSGSVVGTLVDFTDTGATWRVPSTARYGAGTLAIAVDGVLSHEAARVTIASTPEGGACAVDYACATGFCSDGVCCDARCDGACEGCTTAKKGKGADGACGAVPPERFPADACFVSQGAPCSDSAACAAGLTCVDGVCCASSCHGQCEACAVAGSVGECVPVRGAPHGDRAACAGASDPCLAKICDATHRDACDATVGPCTPFACGATSCETSCSGDADCAANYHCDDAGSCVPGLCDGTIATTPQGQTIDCSPYLCAGDGSCRASCGKAADCATGFVCDLEGRCVAPPPNDVLGGCSCAAAGGEGGGGPWTLVAAALAVA
ncbi:MAG TPA: hypothetical protein VHB21_08235, partial [Minicystis sp.]|nr:hypothetical protein [Minicystis sp.]